MLKNLRAILTRQPVIAILRNLAPAAAVATGEALIGAGITVFDVPVNGPDTLTTLELLVKRFDMQALIGASNTLTVESVIDAKQHGARFITTTHMDPLVMDGVKRQNLMNIPGVATLTEASAALRQGAAAVKAYPGEAFNAVLIEAWRAALPPEAILIVSGGVTVENSGSFLRAGADGICAGTALFSPGLPLPQVAERAKKFMAEVEIARGSSI